MMITDPQLKVGSFYRENRERLKLELLTTDAGFDRLITESELHRPGLALAGFIKLFTFHRVQILGNTETRYLKSLPKKKRREALENLFQFEIPCLIITEFNDVSSDMLDIATRRYIPIFRTTYPTTKFYHLLSDFLQMFFAPRTTVHGTLVDVYGVGMLLTGRSGIGKSEIALDLIERGHRLVADDMVIITRKSEEIVMGEGRDISEHIIEIRGLGLVDIRQTFGVRGVRVIKRIEVIVDLVEFDEDASYDRTGLDAQTKSILDVELPNVLLPINPGKNITVIAETIALNQLLREVHGHNTPEEFNKRLMEKMRRAEREHLRKLKTRDFLDKDFE
ncbi:MAG: HPr(Ser) kinase/phosphatase [Calditrichia bacterium]